MYRNENQIELLYSCFQDLPILNIQMINFSHSMIITMQQCKPTYTYIIMCYQESVCKARMTRFYIQMKEDPHGSLISLFVSNLPLNLSQRQYRMILLDIIGQGNQNFLKVNQGDLSIRKLRGILGLFSPSLSKNSSQILCFNQAILFPNRSPSFYSTKMGWRSWNNTSGGSPFF